MGERGILVEDTFFIIGHEHKILSINKQEYQNTLLPMIADMNRMNEWGYFKYRMANMNKNSTLFFSLIMLISILAIYGYFMFEGKTS
ncbi:hypothetical protein NBRC116188_19480 [Oceaniserpentilla sp. 4NH20-0058]|uniref:hypothetical protein n=1 Tax=Oceaniserpentilla sp. 4NH20-0058 TaxID=3127660 RepID=UPI00310A34C0